MMDLTPLEVRKKKGDFKRAMRGYDPALVDDFLDLVADRLDELVRENMTLAERTARQDVQVGEFRDRERALTEALVTAQEMREEMRRQSAREAELALKSAEQETAQMRSTAEHDVAQLRTTAQQEALAVRHSAQQEAAALRQSVSQELLQMRTTAEQALQRAEESVRNLRARQQQSLGTYRGFLERELSEVKVITETLEAGMSSATASIASAGLPAGPAAGMRSAAPAVMDMPSSPAAPLAVSFTAFTRDDEADAGVVAGDDEGDDADLDVFAAAAATDDEFADALEPFEPEPFEPDAVDGTDAADAHVSAPLQIETFDAGAGDDVHDDDDGMTLDLIDDEAALLDDETAPRSDNDAPLLSGDEALLLEDEVAPLRDEQEPQGFDYRLTDPDTVNAPHALDVSAGGTTLGDPTDPRVDPATPLGLDGLTFTGVETPADALTDARHALLSDLLDDDDDDEETTLLLRNAAAAGYRVPDEPELLLDDVVDESGTGSDVDDGGWLPGLLEEDERG